MKKKLLFILLGFIICFIIFYSKIVSSNSAADIISIDEAAKNSFTLKEMILKSKLDKKIDTNKDGKIDFLGILI